MSDRSNHKLPVRPDLEDMWNDLALTRSRVGELVEQGKRSGDLGPAQAALGELQLKTAHLEKLLQEMQAPIKAVLGKNFLGTAEWKRGFEVKVGVPPSIPEYITAELLTSDCPLHPGEKIKDTHILILIPKIVDGQPYSALKLDELCTTRTGSGEKLIEGFYDLWKKEAWANAFLPKSEWVLIPKSDPDPHKVRERRHFRSKKIAEQAEVYKRYAADYREAKALEVMTAALLNDVVNGAPRMLAPMGDNWNFLRCVESTSYGAGVVVGNFFRAGLNVRFDSARDASASVGVALARRA